jgi:hypothetical protein
LCDRLKPEIGSDWTRRRERSDVDVWRGGSRDARMICRNGEGTTEMGKKMDQRRLNQSSSGGAGYTASPLLDCSVWLSLFLLIRSPQWFAPTVTREVADGNRTHCPDP